MYLLSGGLRKSVVGAGGHGHFQGVSPGGQEGEPGVHCLPCLVALHHDVQDFLLKNWFHSRKYQRTGKYRSETKVIVPPGSGRTCGGGKRAIDPPRDFQAPKHLSCSTKQQIAIIPRENISWLRAHGVNMQYLHFLAGDLSSVDVIGAAKSVQADAQHVMQSLEIIEGVNFKSLAALGTKLVTQLTLQRTARFSKRFVRGPHTLLQDSSRANILRNVICFGICYIMWNQQTFRKYASFHYWQNDFAAEWNRFAGWGLVPPDVLETLVSENVANYFEKTVLDRFFVWKEAFLDRFFVWLIIFCDQLVQYRKGTALCNGYSRMVNQFRLRRSQFKATTASDTLAAKNLREQYHKMALREKISDGNLVSDSSKVSWRWHCTITSLQLQRSLCAEIRKLWNLDIFLQIFGKISGFFHPEHFRL